MTHKVDIVALAKLARLDVSAEEMTRLEKEIPDILGFVETIQKVATTDIANDTAPRNVMREDANPHESGKYTEDLLAAAPAQKNNQVVVKQVLSRTK
ncbi:MAG: Asp-tRNA(Asn)/Glu-tRNA(Gln) amidotransferase subunit GatC [Patescibacteria group bacterium]